MSNLEDSVKLHEGLRLKAYQDTKGIWTIGYGANLQELVIDEVLAATWLKVKLDGAEFAARGYTWFDTLSQPRKDVIVEMVYNLGPARFAGFKQMHQALALMKWENAADEMQNSKWDRDVGDGPGGKDDRADHLIRQMRTGEYWNVV